MVISSCDVTKYLGEGEYIYSGTEVELQNPERFNKKAQLKADLEYVSQPKVNTSGFKVWVYHNFTKPKGLSKFIRERLGEPLSIYDESLVNRSELVMEKYLKDRGYFGSEVAYDTIITDRTVVVKYNAISNGQYQIGKIHLPSDTTKIGALVIDNQDKTKLKENKFYNIADLEQERLRLTEIAKNQGFFNFSNNYFYYFIDTTGADLKTDLYLRIKQPTDSTFHQQYHIGEAYFYPQYDLNDVTGLEFPDTIKTERLTIYDKKTSFLRPSALEETLSQQEGELFSANRQEQTINHLLDLGVFKFVNVKYRQRQLDSLVILDRYLYLTPTLTRDFTAGVEFSSDNSRNLGIGGSVTYANRNLFKGAEQLNLSLSAGVETQSGSESIINTIDLSGKVELVFPRFIAPFKIPYPNSPYVPRTRISLSENYQERVNNYTLNSAQLRYTFDWRQTSLVRHELTVFNLNLVNLLSRTDDFQKLLDANRRLRTSFDKSLILGFIYRHSYSDQKVNTRQNFSYLQTQIETSGNLVQAIKSLGNSPNQPAEILGLPYSQYVKFETDGRYNILYKNASLVGRVNLGVGVPYGNSDYLPYIKQFYAGGANSVRAFLIRELGPGTSQPSIDSTAVGFFDQTGDIKIEMNLEYRFDILPAFYLKGAAFIDAGNVWLIKDPAGENPDGLFNINTFYKELAVGAGFGLRLDINFIVLRLDAAIPLRLPYEPDGERWQFDNLNFNQTRYNIAIGYPF